MSEISKLPSFSSYISESKPKETGEANQESSEGKNSEAYIFAIQDLAKAIKNLAKENGGAERANIRRVWADVGEEIYVFDDNMANKIRKTLGVEQKSYQDY